MTMLVYGTPDCLIAAERNAQGLQLTAPEHLVERLRLEIGRIYLRQQVEAAKNAGATPLRVQHRSDEFIRQLSGKYEAEIKAATQLIALSQKVGHRLTPWAQRRGMQFRYGLEVTELGDSSASPLSLRWATYFARLWPTQPGQHIISFPGTRNEHLANTLHELAEDNMESLGDVHAKLGKLHPAFLQGGIGRHGDEIFEISGSVGAC